MLGITRWALLVAAMALTAGQAQAQYGWTGWGSNSGGLGRGLGNLYAGRGAYNEENAVAGAINTNTTMRWNNALHQATQASASRYNAQNRANLARNDKDRAQVQDRVRNHPEQGDITDGDTLNALLTELLSPANAAKSLTRIKTPLRSDSIRDIPFEAASEDITICLHQMTMEGQWPLALNVPAFKPERDALHAAVARAMKADEDGSLDPAMIAAVQTAITNLRTKFEREVPASNPDHYPARDTIKALAGLTKILHSPRMEQVLAELEDYQGTTLGDLLGFMQSFNLRFAPANSFRQRQIYQKLYPMFAEQANGTMGSAIGGAAASAVNAAEQAGGDAIGGLKAAATDLFKSSK